MTLGLRTAKDLSESHWVSLQERNISSFGRRGICVQEKTSSRPMSLREESILTHLNCYSSKTYT
ncbi:hypothetical protein PRBEI_2001726200 [Prionailurus iriomotensis]